MTLTLRVDHLSNSELLSRLHALVGHEHRTVAELLAHLAEVDFRKLYLEQACSSLFKYCTDRLGLSEHAAYKRITVARASRRFPILLQVVADGRLHLAGLCALTPHLTAGNHQALVADAAGKTLRQVEQLLADRFPKPDVAASVRRLQSSRTAASAPAEAGAGSQCANEEDGSRHNRTGPTGSVGRQRTRGAGLAARRVDRGGSLRSRHIPAEVRREVFQRDGGQCTYVDAQGRRCSERRFLHFEHRVPFARGGNSSPENVCLLCAAHNARAAQQAYGSAKLARERQTRETVWRAQGR